MPFDSALTARSTFWRTLLTFSITRVVIAVLFVAYLSLNVKGAVSAASHLNYWHTCFIYLLLALFFVVTALRWRKQFLLQLWTQIAVDFAVISFLYVAADGIKSGLAILFLFPLAGGAILAPMVLALFFASIATLILLGESGYQYLSMLAEPTFFQAGLYGASFFASVLVLNRLAASLIKQEELAQQRGLDLQMQEAINRLVIADMGDGILVISGNGAVLTANPAAESMLGMRISHTEPYALLMEIPTLTPIAEAFFAWSGKVNQHALEQTDATAYVVIKPGDSGVVQPSRRELTAHLKLRFANVKAANKAESRAVIFLQDVSEIDNQAQQLKLASMGRLTASIAHEVRNPLSAISYASSLMKEEISDPSQVRLISIIGDNVGRLNRMIEDILKLSRKAQARSEPLKLASFLEELVEEFSQTHALPPHLIHLGEIGPHRIWFDPLHLREVILNLLSNAVRYASKQEGCIRIYAIADNVNRLELHVQDDGVPITPEVRAHLFEPFHTTSSKGTGLGLYLARELCLNNGAMIDYEYCMDAINDQSDQIRGRFVITIASAN